MTFPIDDPKTPTTVQTVTVTLVSDLVWDEGDPEAPPTIQQRAEFRLYLLDQDGGGMGGPSGSLGQPLLTQAEVDWLIGFMDRMRMLAQAALPTT